jgi:predicted DNA-binding protein YlxM (UPF0122 family)
LTNPRNRDILVKQITLQGCFAVFEKNLTVEFLLDFYGEVLAPRTRDLLAAYYGDDLSLAEIAEGEQISRQGVRHILKKGEEELFFLEERLGLAARHRAMQEAAERIRTLAAALRGRDDAEVTALLTELSAFSARYLDE